MDCARADFEACPEPAEGRRNGKFRFRLYPLLNRKLQKTKRQGLKPPFSSCRFFGTTEVVPWHFLQSQWNFARGTWKLTASCSAAALFRISYFEHHIFLLTASHRCVVAYR